MSTIAASDLIAQLCLKNEKAFSYLYDNYSGALFNVIIKKVKCQLTSEEILQNVFLKIWMHIDSYSQIKSSLYTWMLSIAKHETIDYLRSKQARERRVISCVDFKELFEKAGTDAPGSAEQKLDYQDLFKCLYLLPYKERTIIELWHMGFTCLETGRLIGMPEGSVKTKMRMAYKKLRHHLYKLDPV